MSSYLHYGRVQGVEYSVSYNTSASQSSEHSHSSEHLQALLFAETGLGLVLVWKLLQLMSRARIRKSAQNAETQIYKKASFGLRYVTMPGAPELTAEETCLAAGTISTTIMHLDATRSQQS